MSLDVIYEDNHLIAVNKNAGDISQGDKTGDLSLPDKIKQWLKIKYNKPGEVFLGVAHRLDRPTTGVLVFAKTSKGLSRMGALLKTREVSKKYWAIVEAKPNKIHDTLIHYLLKNKRQNKSYSVNEENKGAKKAILEYRWLLSSDNYHLLEIELHTGRHHQIRAQLATIGCVIKGDVKYGAKRPNVDKSISLHAREIRFVHPIKKEELEIIAPVPEDSLWKWFEKETEHK